jgi:hypothetical protein
MGPPNGAAAELYPAAWGGEEPRSRAQGSRLQPRDGPRERPQHAASSRRRPDAPTARCRRAGGMLSWTTAPTISYQLHGTA